MARRRKPDSAWVILCTGVPVGAKSNRSDAVRFVDHYVNMGAHRKHYRIVRYVPAEPRRRAPVDK